MNRLIIGITVLGISSCIVSQTTSKPPQSNKTAGACSPITVGSNNTFHFNGDCGIGRQQGEEIISLLNELLKENSPSEVMDKLNEIHGDLQKLKEEAAHRTLTPVQKSRLSAFAASHPNGVLKVWAYSMENETTTYATEITRAFGPSWKIAPPDIVPQNEPLHGLTIAVNDKQAKDRTVPTFCVDLIQEMRAASFEVRGLPTSDLPPGSCLLMVGPK